LSSDVKVTGGTYDINTGIVTFTNNSGGTFNVTGFTSGMTDTFVTGGTFSSSTLTLNRQNGLVTITGFSSSVLVNKTTYVDALNGNDGTGVRGDMSLPYLTISGANQTAITGDTVHVRPGTYQENDIVIDGISYYFDKGSIVHPTEAQQVADVKGIIDIDGYTYKANILGYGEFISDNNTNTDSRVGCIYVSTEEAHIEFYLAYMRASSGSGSPRGSVNAKHTGTNGQEVFIKGIVKKDNSQGGDAHNALLVGQGNIRFEGKIIQNSVGSAGTGLYVNNDSANFRGTGDIFCSGDTADSYAFRTNSRGKTLWYGNIVAGNQATCYAYKTDSSYIGDSAIFGKFTGAIVLSLSGHEGRGSYISGMQECTNSPNGYAITCDDDSYNVVDLVISSYVDVFNVSLGAVLFQGTASMHGWEEPFLTQSGGKFVFNGMINDIYNKRLKNNILTGGECVIQSDYESWGNGGAANEYVFYVDGGTLRVEGAKIENHQYTTGSGVIEMTSHSGSTLILNGATLIAENLDPTSYSIKTPTAGSLDIQIYNDSYTNRPVGTGTIWNTVPNGGFLYDLTGCTTVRRYCDWNVSGKTTTTNFQMTSGATDGYILTSDAVGNASWQPSIDGNTFVTGFTYDDINTFTISDNSGSTFNASINVLSATTISGGTLYGDGSNLTGISTENTTITGFTYDNANTFTISDSSGSTFDASIDIMTGLTINGESTGTTLTVNGQSVFSGESTDVVQIYGSGSTSPIFRVQGSSGELFSITDDLIGELFAVNNISGLPILQVYSDNRIILGDNLAPSLYTTATVTANSGGTTNIYSVPVSAYTGAWFEYTAKGTTSLRAGNIASIFSGSSVNHNETTTTDIGDTSDLLLDVIISGTSATLTASATTSNWEIKTIIRSI